MPLVTRIFRLTCVACAAVFFAGPQTGSANSILDWIPINFPGETIPLTSGGGQGGASIASHERAKLSNDVGNLVAGSQKFAIDLYQRISAEKSPHDNLLASPLSISTAFGMAYAGARGNTAQEMASVLGFNLPQNQVHSAFGELIRDLDVHREGYELSIANRLFGQYGSPWQQDFLDITGHHYGASLEETDFIGNPEASRHRINQWVEEKTNDKIKDLLPQGSISPDTRLVLTNAIYFNGQWKHEFAKEATRDEVFYAADGTEKLVPTMFQQQKFGYGNFDGFQMLEVPYAGDDLSMVIMLPHEQDGLPALEASLTSELIDDSLAALRTHEVAFHLPKFKFDASFTLGRTLQDMGMKDAFGENADFSGMTLENVQISDVMHKAFIEVNEEGTEAAAATGIIVGIVCLCQPPEPVEFRADHPFMFALRDRHSGSLMFMGRVADPEGTVITGAETLAVPEPSSAILAFLGIAMLSRYRLQKPRINCQSP